MKYACLIHYDERHPDVTTGADHPRHTEIMAAWDRFGEAARAAGVFVSAEPLASAATTTSVQLRDGQVIATDGPFAETKEQLGGFYILDCATLDEAISWAARIPAAAYGTIEVRPLADLG